MTKETKQKIEYRKISELKGYDRNARLHSDEQVKQIMNSIEEFGFNNPILVDENDTIIAGHGRLMASERLNLKQVPTIKLTHLTEEQKRAYVIVDNRLTENSEWDIKLLSEEVDDLLDFGMDLDLLGFDENFFDEDDENDINDGQNSNEESEEHDEELANNPYTTKIEAPTYEPKGDKPALSELIDTTVTDKLCAEIDKSNLSNEEKAFLKKAAERHTVFNFGKIANYYAHSGIEMQDHIENSAMVIIDYDKALERGFVNIREEMENQLKDENDDI